MSNDISRVYQFLAKQGADNAWVDMADANGDGAVTKTEFRNFMNENFEWDGETTDAGKNDLINKFWKEVDTIVSGKVSGTKIKNKNALDKKEVENMESKIKLYEELNDYTSTITVPSFINNGSNWLKSVSEGLSNLVEKNYTGKPEDLENWLDSENRAATVMAKATADYCANEYIANVMADAAKEYGYAYGDDSTLQGLINNYIQNHLDGFNPDEINDAVRDIIDSYMSTANLSQIRGGVEDLKDYGYNPTEKSPLNDLQKAVIKSKLEKSISSEKNYEKYKELYDTAMTSFLDGLKYGDFSKVNTNVLSEFKASDVYKNMDKAIQAKETFLGNDLKTALNKEIGESISSRINGVMVGEIPSYDKIVNDAMTKAQNGDFDNTSGTLDKTKLINWIVDQIKANLADFYPNGFGDMPIDELNNMYDALVKSAKENQDAQKVKDAAISYCKTISAKSERLAQAVRDVCETDDYASKIKTLTTGEIETLMNKLKAEVAKIGDVTKMTDSEKANLFNGINSSYTLNLGEELTFYMPNTAKCNGKDVITDRIKYSGSGNALTVDENSGKVTLNTTEPGKHTGTIYVIIDGVKVTSKEITVVVQKSYKAENIIDNITEWSGTAPNGVTVMEGAYGNSVGDSISTKDFANLYNNDGIICLGFFKDNDNYNWSKNGAAEVKNRLTGLGQYVIDTLATAMPDVDMEKLKTAMKNVVNKYAVNPTGDYYKKKNSGDTPANFYNYMKDNKNKVKNGLVQTKDSDGKDSNVYGLYFKEFVDAIIAEYNKLMK